MDTPAPRSRLAPQLLFAALLAGLLAYRFGPELGLRTGSAATVPDLELVTLSGDTLRTAELRGSVVLVNFWATWCAPCRVEMPMLQDVWEEYRDDGLVVVGVYTDEGVVADLVAWFRDAGIDYPFVRSTAAVERALGFGGTLPTSLVIDREGRVAARVVGIYPEAALRETLDGLLTGPTPDPSPAERTAPAARDRAEGPPPG